MADKVTSKPQKLSGHGWQPCEILEDNAPREGWRFYHRARPWALAGIRARWTVHRGHGSIRWDGYPPKGGYLCPKHSPPLGVETKSTSPT